MPDGAIGKTRRGWLVRRLKVGDLVEIRHSERPPIDLTVRRPVFYRERVFLVMESTEGIRVHIPMRAIIEPVPGLLLAARRPLSVAVSCDPSISVRFVHVNRPPEPIPF